MQVFFNHKVLSPHAHLWHFANCTIIVLLLGVSMVWGVYGDYLFSPFPQILLLLFSAQTILQGTPTNLIIVTRKAHLAVMVPCHNLQGINTQGLFGYNGSVPFHYTNGPFPSVSKWREGHFHRRNVRPTEQSHFLPNRPLEPVSIRPFPFRSKVLKQLFLQVKRSQNGTVASLPLLPNRLLTSMSYR